MRRRRDNSPIITLHSDMSSEEAYDAFEACSFGDAAKLFKLLENNHDLVAMKDDGMSVSIRTLWLGSL